MAYKSKILLFFCIGIVLMPSSHLKGRDVSLSRINQMRKRSAREKPFFPSEESPPEKGNPVLDKVAQFLKPRYTVYTDMTYEELKEARSKLRESDYDTIAKYTERLIALCDSPHERALFLLEFADALFQAGSYEKAGMRYTEFSKLYPGHEKTEYALYRAILASSKRILSLDRDQTKTEDTIALTDAFLERAVFTQYKQDVLAIRTQCYERLIEHGLYIGNFYLKRAKFKSVEQRLASVMNDLLPNAPHMKDRCELFAQTVQETKEQKRLEQEKKNAQEIRNAERRLAKAKRGKKQKAIQVAQQQLDKAMKRKNKQEEVAEENSLAITQAEQEKSAIPTTISAAFQDIIGDSEPYLEIQNA